MATFKMALDTRRAKVDGTFPIVFKITVKRKQVIISTGICVLQDSFCKRSGLVLVRLQTKVDFFLVGVSC